MTARFSVMVVAILTTLTRIWEICGLLDQWNCKLLLRQIGGVANAIDLVETKYILQNIFIALNVSVTCCLLTKWAKTGGEWIS